MSQTRILASEDDGRPQAKAIVVLLIEDNPADVRLIREQLAEVCHPFFELRVAGSLSTGMTEIASAKPDIVLLDLGLPDSQGLDTLLHLRACLPDVPIVVLTGLDDETLSLEAVKAGAQDYLVKGWQNGRQLTLTLRNSIQRHKLQRELRSHASNPDPDMEDGLTGLYNRHSFTVLARQAMKVAYRTSAPLVILSMDVEGLRQHEDAYWHATGDQALLETANLLRATFHEAEILARLDGDQFAVLALLTPDDDVDAVLSRLTDNLNELNARPNRAARLSLSVGIGRYDPARPCSVEELLAQADRSRYEHRTRQRTP